MASCAEHIIVVLTRGKYYVSDQGQIIAYQKRKQSPRGQELSKAAHLYNNKQMQEHFSARD